MRELKGDWRDLFNGFMLALDLRKMFLGFLGLALSLGAVGLFLAWVDHKDPLVLRDPTVLRLDPAMAHAPVCKRVFHPRVVMDTTSPGLTCQGVRLALHEMATHVFGNPHPGIRIGVPLGVGLLLVLIWSYFGGAIARIAAVEVARDERIETQKSLHFAAKKYGAFFWAPLVCLIGFLFFALCNLAGGVVGWLLHFGGIGPLLVALFVPLAVLSGFIMALILLGSAFGWTLFYPAVGAEGTDSFDAISRGFSYVYSRPWHYAWYQVVSIAYGVVSVWFVWWFGVLMLKLGLGAGRAGIGLFGSDPGNPLDRILPSFLVHDLFGVTGPEVESDPGRFGYADGNQFLSLGPLQKVAAVVLSGWLVVIFGMLAGYAASFFFSSQTLVYFLLRKKVDGIEMNEVYEEKEEEFKPETAAPAGESGAPPPAAPGGPDEKK